MNQDDYDGEAHDQVIDCDKVEVGFEEILEQNNDFDILRKNASSTAQFKDMF